MNLSSATTAPPLTWIRDIDGLSEVSLYRWRELHTSWSVLSPIPRTDSLIHSARAVDGDAFAYVPGGVAAAIDAAKQLILSGERPAGTIGVGTARNGEAYLVGMTSAVAPYRTGWQRFAQDRFPFDRGMSLTRAVLAGRHGSLSHIVNPPKPGSDKPIATPLAWYDGARY